MATIETSMGCVDINEAVRKLFESARRFEPLGPGHGAACTESEVR